jgi:hypothetical protein
MKSKKKYKSCTLNFPLYRESFPQCCSWWKTGKSSVGDTNSILNFSDSCGWFMLIPYTFELYVELDFCSGDNCFLTLKICLLSFTYKSLKFQTNNDHSILIIAGCWCIGNFLFITCLSLCSNDFFLQSLRFQSDWLDKEFNLIWSCCCQIVGL